MFYTQALKVVGIGYLLTQFSTQPRSRGILIAGFDICVINGAYTVSVFIANGGNYHSYEKAISTSLP